MATESFQLIDRPGKPAPSSLKLAESFRELHRLILSEHDDYADLYGDYLVTGLQLLDMEIGVVSRVHDDIYTILAVAPDDCGLSAGQTFALSETYCTWVVANACSIAVEHVGSDKRRAQHPFYRQLKLESYLAAPIWVEGQIFGTLNFTDTRVRRVPFSPEDVELVELMARGLSRVIERDRLEQRRSLDAQRLRENIGLFESAFEYASVGMALVAPDGRWLRVNRALSMIVGYSEDDLLTIDFQTITHPDDLDADLEYVREMIDGVRSTYQMEKRYFHRDGHIIWALLSVSLVRYEDGSPRYFVSQIHDITAEKQAREELYHKRSELEIANAKLKQLATRDTLTQVLNRRAFEERLEEELQRATRSSTPLSLLLIDVDHFKRYNDSFGHPAGDHALREVAKALTAGSRIHDVVARYGGEEFAVILPNTEQQGSHTVAERLRRTVADITNTRQPLTISIGTATIDPRLVDINGLSNTTLVSWADQALYNAKAAGRNQVRQAADTLPPLNDTRPDHP